MFQHVEPMGVYETLFAFQAATGTYLGSEGTSCVPPPRRPPPEPSNVPLRDPPVRAGLPAHHAAARRPRDAQQRGVDASRPALPGR